MPAKEKKKTSRTRTTADVPPLAEYEVEDALAVILQTAATWLRMHDEPLTNTTVEVAMDQRFLWTICNAARAHEEALPLVVEEEKIATTVKHHHLTRSLLKVAEMEQPLRDLCAELRESADDQVHAKLGASGDAALATTLRERCSAIGLPINAERAAEVIASLRKAHVLSNSGGSKAKRLSIDRAIPVFFQKLGLEGLSTLRYLRRNKEAAKRRLERRRAIDLSETLDLVLVRALRIFQSRDQLQTAQNNGFAASLTKFERKLREPFGTDCREREAALLESKRAEREKKQEEKKREKELLAQQRRSNSEKQLLTLVLSLASLRAELERSSSKWDHEEIAAWSPRMQSPDWSKLLQVIANEAGVPFLTQPMVPKRERIPETVSRLLQSAVLHGTSLSPSIRRHLSRLEWMPTALRETILSRSVSVLDSSGANISRPAPSIRAPHHGPKRPLERKQD